MTRAITAELATELIAATEHLDVLGAALVSAFHTAPFPVCSRLARAIRTTMSPSYIWKTLQSDTFARADAMLRDVRALHLAVDGLPGIGPDLVERVHLVGDILLDYRTSLNPCGTLDG